MATRRTGHNPEKSPKNQRFFGTFLRSKNPVFVAEIKKIWYNCSDKNLDKAGVPMTEQDEIRRLKELVAKQQLQLNN